MIIKFYKIINNKFSRFFKFIFFLRYLLAIFLVAITSFLLIPNFFDYGKKEKIINTYLSTNLGLNIDSIKNIEYKSFPLPNLEVTGVNSSFRLKDTELQSKKLLIFPKLTSVYDFKSFEVKKIIFKNTNINSDIKNIKNLSERFLKSKIKIKFENLNVKINDKGNYLFDLKKIKLSNFGFKKNFVLGEIFDKKFNIKINNEFLKYDFKLLKTGIIFTIKFIEKKNNSKLTGHFKGQALKSNLKFDFIYDGKIIEVDNLYYRDKDLSFDSEGQIEIKPYFKIHMRSIVKDMNFELFRSFIDSDILYSKNLIKKINIKTTIIYKPKKFLEKTIENFETNLDLSYGRLNMKKYFIIADSKFDCISNTNLLEEYPVLSFKCSIYSSDKRKLLRKFKINSKKNIKNFEIEIKGNINILNNKINFDYIKLDKSNNLSKEDLKYYKSTFENILFDKTFIDIFNKDKIKNFILEIS